MWLPGHTQRAQEEARKQAGAEAKRVAEAAKKAGQARQQLEIAVKASAEVSEGQGQGWLGTAQMHTSHKVASRV
jgi:hypothetical protein